MRSMAGSTRAVWHCVTGAAFVVLLAACLPFGGGRGVAEPAVPAPGIAEPGVAMPAPWPECTGVELAFFGENTTLAAIGLGEMGGPDANRPGTIWVTAEPVDPDVVGGPPGPQAPPQRWVCVQWADGSGMGGTIDDDWQPPGALDGIVDGDATSANPAVPIAALAIGLLVVAVISWLAFRREERTG